MNAGGSPAHHPSVAALEPIQVLQPEGFQIDCVGVRSRVEFLSGMPGEPSASPECLVTPSLPTFDEEYFEWIDVLEAASQAGDEFVMVELGAGFGRWSVRAAAALRRLKPGTRFHCVAVEAEPQHFRWLCQHFRDNGFDPDDLDLTWAAVGPNPGFVPFRVGESNAWYGQAIDRSDSPRIVPAVRARRRLKARSVLGRPPVFESDQRSVTWVPCVTLTELIAPYPRIDLIDLDVQRQEFDVLHSAIDLLDDRVRRIHVGTHTVQIEAQLRILFGERGWTPLNDYARRSCVRTRYGEITFGDGVQTWVNPRLDSRATVTQSVTADADALRVRSSGAEIVAAAREVVATAKSHELKERNRELTQQNRALSREVKELRRRERQLKVQIREILQLPGREWLAPVRRIYRSLLKLPRSPES